MFYLLFFGLAGFVLHRANKLGPRQAIWAGWLIAMMLLPAWMNNRVGSLQLDLRTAAAAAGVAGFLFFAQPGLNIRWALADLLVVFLIYVQAVSQANCGDLRPLTVPDIMRRWLLPYLMGRLFLGSGEDISRAMPVICRICLVLSLYAMFEAIIKINPINLALGKTFGLLEEGEGYRMGLKRAQGPMDHPIFFGMALVMVFPWSIEAWRQSRVPGNPSWWAYLPWLMGGALFATVSRGPQLAAMASLYATAFFRYPRLRIWLLLLALLGGAGAYAGKELVKEQLGKMAGESNETVIMITIDGEPTEYTGTLHRVLLFQVYADAIDTAGLYGFGFELKGIHLEESIAERFGSIDNHYLLFYLQHGYLGMGAFLLLATCVIIYLGKAAWDVRRPESAFAGTLCGAMFAVTVLLVSVWFAPDFGAVYLFCAGLASSIHTFPRKIVGPQPPNSGTTTASAPKLRLPRKLSLGCAPIRGA